MKMKLEIDYKIRLNGAAIMPSTDQKHRITEAVEEILLQVPAGESKHSGRPKGSKNKRKAWTPEETAHVIERMNTLKQQMSVYKASQIIGAAISRSPQAITMKWWQQSGKKAGEPKPEVAA